MVPKEDCFGRNMPFLPKLLFSPKGQFLPKLETSYQLWSCSTVGALQKGMVGAVHKGRDEQPVPEHQQRIHRQPQPAHAGKEPLPPLQDDGPHRAESGGVRAAEPQADSQLHLDAPPLRDKVEVPARRPIGEQTAQG